MTVRQIFVPHIRLVHYYERIRRRSGSIAKN